jgi:hypothetical protein
MALSGLVLNPQTLNIDVKPLNPDVKPPEVKHVKPPRKIREVKPFNMLNLMFNNARKIRGYNLDRYEPNPRMVRAMLGETSARILVRFEENLRKEN